MIRSLSGKPPSIQCRFKFKANKFSRIRFFVFGERKRSVEEAPTSPRSAVTVEFVAGVFDGEFVVVRELFPSVDLPQGEDDDVLPALHVDDSGVAVGLAGVVDEPRSVAVHGGVHNVEVVDTEHVTPNALAVIVLLSFVCEN